MEQSDKNRINKKYFLAIDVGNTETVLGIFQDEELLDTWRLRSDLHVTPDEIELKISNFLSMKGYNFSDIESVALSSVVPVLTQTICATSLHDLTDFITVNSSIQTGIKISIDNPTELGSDRIVNAVAAKHIYKEDCIVVDFGTATTFDAVSSDGEYLGGAISPGIMISSEALFRSGARLLQVSLNPPKRSVGKNTVESLQSGIVYGFTGLVDGLIEKMCDELGWKPVIVLTGGLGGIIHNLTKYTTIYDPHLTLKGLRIIHSIQNEKANE